MQKERLGRDLTRGGVTATLLRFALPFMLSNALQAAYSIVDMLVVGQYVGSAGLSAVSVSSQVVNLMTSLCMGFATSGQVCISQLVGGQRREELQRTIGTLFTTVGALALLMTAAGLLCTPVFLRLLNVPEAAFDAARSYLLICSGGVVFIYGYNTVSAILRGMGDSDHPLVFIGVATAANVALDLLLVGACGMGTAGAALATVCSQAFSFTLSLVFLFRRRAAFGFDFRPASFRVDRQALRPLAKLGLPFALQMASIDVSMLFVSRLVNTGGGVIGSAAFGVFTRLQQIPDILSRSIGMATSGMVGQCLGANDHRRVDKSVHTALLFNAAIWCVFVALFRLFPEAFFSLFTSEKAVLAMAGLCATACLSSLPANAIMGPCNSFVTAVGDAKFCLLIALLDGVVARILLSYLLGDVFRLGMIGYFLGFSLATYVTAVPTYLYFLRGKWKQKSFLRRE